MSDRLAESVVTPHLAAGLRGRLARLAGERPGGARAGNRLLGGLPFISRPVRRGDT